MSRGLNTDGMFLDLSVFHPWIVFSVFSVPLWLARI